MGMIEWSACMCCYSYISQKPCMHACRWVWEGNSISCEFTHHALHVYIGEQITGELSMLHISKFLS